MDNTAETKGTGIIRKFLTISFSTGINILLSFFTTPIITRIVDPAEMGKMTMFNAYTTITASFLYLGLNEALLRFYFNCKNESEKQSLLKLCFTVPFSLSVILSFLAFFLLYKRILPIDYSYESFILLCICITLTVWERMSNEMMQNTLNSRMYSFASVFKKIVYCFGSIILLKKIQGHDFNILALTTTLSVLISVLIGTAATRNFWRFTGVSFPENIREIFRYSLPMYVYFVVYSLFDSVDKLFVERFCSDYEVGVYGTTFSLVGIFSVVQFAFMVLWRPLQTEHYTQNPNDMSFIQKGNRYITILMFFLGINTIMFKDVICLLLGEAYRSGARLIPFLVFNPIMNTMIWTVTSGIEISKKSYLNIYIILTSLLVLAAGSIILIPRIGVKGSGICVALALIVQYYMTLYYSNKNRYIDYSLGKMTSVLIIMLIFAFISTFYESGILIAAAYLICMAALCITYREDIKEVVISAVKYAGTVRKK